MIAVSMRSTPEPAVKLATTTISWSALRPDTGAEPKRPFLQDYKPWLVLVLATAILLYVIFSIGII